MDLQTYFQNAVQAQRDRRMATSDQLTLGKLIAKIEPIVAKQGDRFKEGREEATVRYDFEYLFPNALYSWRGAYAELALNYETSGAELTVSDFLKLLRSAVGNTFEGYKGGEFTMSESTPVWVANWGNSGNTAVVDVVDNDYVVILITGYREY